jgi:integrase
LLAAIDNGTGVDPSPGTLAEYLRTWLDGAHHLAPKTMERYRELAEHQIVPYLGATVLQKLRPSHIPPWHELLRRTGGRNGRPLAPRTIGHAHRVLHAALEHAVKIELLSRNVASVISPPKVEIDEIESLTDVQSMEVLGRLEEHEILPVAVMAIGTGMRRGELCGLRWGDLDFDTGVVTVNHSLEETNAGLRLRVPKSRSGRRLISLPAFVTETLRAHRVRQI